MKMDHYVNRYLISLKVLHVIISCNEWCNLQVYMKLQYGTALSRN